MENYLWCLEGWLATTGDTVVRRFNVNTGVWTVTGFAACPASGIVASPSGTLKNQGGWDGTYWYIIGSDGKLYRYDPTANTWSAALNAGTAIITGTAASQQWVMESDGRYVYILDSQNGFRKYDPVTDSLSTLATITGSGGGYSNRLFLAFDGNNTIYGGSGGTAGTYGKYSISGNTWTALSTANPITIETTQVLAAHGFFLQGKLWVLYYHSSMQKYRSLMYDPSNDTWISKAENAALGNEIHHIMACARTENTIGLWYSNFQSIAYDVVNNLWSFWPLEGGTLRLQGYNIAQQRTFAPQFTWYESDGTTLMGATEDLGTLATGTTNNYHYKLKTAFALAPGVTVSVVADLSSDAEDVVTVCETSGGSFGTSFNHSAALSAGDVIDVYVRVSPTGGQTPNQHKPFNLKATPN